MLKNLFNNNKELIICSAIILIIAGSITFYRDYELKEHGIIVEGTIIECNMILKNGECIVDVAYTTVGGLKKTTKLTLYNKSNCEVGKKVRLQYSNASDLTYVIE